MFTNFKNTMENHQSDDNYSYIKTEQDDSGSNQNRLQQFPSRNNASRNAVNTSTNPCTSAVSETSTNPGTSAVSNTSTNSGTSTNFGSSMHVNDKMNFQYRKFVVEARKKQIWALEFNNFGPFCKSDVNINHFVALGGTQFSIYNCTSNGEIQHVMCFEDPDKNEDFYACCWSVIGEPKRSVLVTAGVRGVIRICVPKFLAKNKEKCWDVLIGHSAAVNQLKISTHMPFLLASCSTDRSVRLWNIETLVCIANFHGDSGHRDTAVTIDFNHDCSKLVSGGIDHMIAIWDLSTSEIVSAIKQSQQYSYRSVKGFKTIYQPYPMYATREIHRNYVDCVKWHGDLILSKSNLCDLYCWKPELLFTTKSGVTKTRNDFTMIAEFDVQDCGYYFVRFNTNNDRSILGLGNSSGTVQLWDLTGSDPNNLQCIELDHPKRKVLVRDLSFSRCGRDLIFCADNGTIWLYQNDDKSDYYNTNKYKYKNSTN